MPSPRGRRSVGFALGGISALLAAWAALETHFFRNVEFLSYDLRVSAARPPAVDPRIVLVNIDDSSVRPQALGRWPWPRDVHARLVDLLTMLGAEAIVFDVEFVEPQAPYLDMEWAEEVARVAGLVVGRDDALVPYTRQKVKEARDLIDAERADDAHTPLRQLQEDLAVYEGQLRVYFERLLVRPDEELASAIRRSGRVLLPVHFTAEKATNPPAGPLRDSSWAVPEPDPWPISQPALEPPVPGFAEGVSGFGSVTTPLADGDRIFRRVRPLHRHSGRLYAQLGLKAGLDRGGTHWSVETHPREVRFRSPGDSFDLPVDEQGNTLLDWPKGPIPSLFRQHSYIRVVEPARLAFQIDAIVGKLEGLVKILELAGVPAWPARGPEAYLRNWNSQAAFLTNLEGMLSRYEPPAQYKRETKDLALAYLRKALSLHQSRSRAFEGLRDEFRGKVVFIGSTQRSSTDLKATSTHPDLPGVFFHATLANMVLQKRFVRPVSPRAKLFVVFCAALVATAIASFGRPSVTGPLTALLVAGYVSAAFAAFSWWRLTLPVAAPVLVSVVPYAVVLAWRLATEERERRLVRSIFTHYLSPKLVDRLLEDPSRAGLGGERREVTVLFSDVHGFTSFVENNPSELVVRTLNEYLQTITEVILRNGGYLDKYLGDGILALYGIFDGTPEDAALEACRTALAAQERLNDFRARQASLRHPLRETRFGIASGSAVVGNVGTAEKLNYTAIGDAVNVAARLQVMNKRLKTLVLIDEATWRKVSAKVEARSLGAQEVEGREKPVEVYELRSILPQR